MGLKEIFHVISLEYFLMRINIFILRNKLGLHNLNLEALWQFLEKLLI